MTDTVSRSPIRIVSTTITRLADAHKVPDALRSTAWLADECHVIWTSPDLIPMEIVASDARIHCFAWTGRFDDARNESLRVARDDGADWSIMLDSDERLVMPNPSAVRAWLADLPPRVQIVCALSAEGTYQRERFFRGTIPQRWKFRTHESIDAGEGEQVTIPPELIVWAELPKTGEQVRAKSERDLELIKQDLLEHPTEGRLLFYLGNTLSHLGRYDEAIDAYRKVAEIGTGEGCAWACFCAARIYFEKGKDAGEKRGDTAEMWRCVNKALDCCAAGIHRETRIAELHWLRAAILHGVGKHEEAIAWAEQAKVHGYGSRSYPSRHGFMVPHALKEGPDYVISMCLASIAAGDTPKPPEPMAGIRFPEAAPAVVAPPAPRIEIVREPVHITVTGTGFRAGRWAAKCIESVRAQTVKAEHRYIAADDETLRDAREVKSDVIDGRGKNAFENLVPLWRSLPPEEVVVWLDGDDWLARDDALEIVARAHEAGAWMTYGQFRWLSTGAEGFAAQHDHAAPRLVSPWRATILRTFRAGLVHKIRPEDLMWPRLDEPGALNMYTGLHNTAAMQLRDWSFSNTARAKQFAGKFLDATLDQAIMLPCLELCGPERAKFIPEVLAVYMDENLIHMTDATRFHEREALLYIRSRPEYERLGAL